MPSGAGRKRVSAAVSSSSCKEPDADAPEASESELEKSPTMPARKRLRRILADESESSDSEDDASSSVVRRPALVR